MLYRPFQNACLISIVLFLAINCGGDSKTENPPDDVPPVPPVVPTGPSNVSGQLVSINGALAGVSVLIKDYTAGGQIEAITDGAGNFAFSLGQFSLGSNYSFSLVDGAGKRIADIDFDTSTAGAQPILRFVGPFGLSIGRLMLEETIRGTISAPNGVSAVARDGFVLQMDQTLAEVKPQSLVPVEVRSALFLEDTRTILNHFYQRESNPTQFATSLARLGALHYLLTETVSRPAGEEYQVVKKDWFTSDVKVYQSEWSQPGTGRIWGELSYLLFQDDQLSLFSREGSVSPSGRAVKLGFGVPNQPYQAQHLFFLEEIVAVPSRPTVLRQEGLEDITLDYTGSGLDGLTKPVSPQSLDATILADLPVSVDGVAVTNPQEMSITFTYLKDGVILENPAGSLFEAFEVDNSWTLGDRTYQWTYSNLTLTRQLTAADTQLNFDVPGVLLNFVSESKPDLIKLSLTLKTQHTYSSSSFLLFPASAAK